eukprot:2984210-Rhodomonas_salina.1
MRRSQWLFRRPAKGQSWRLARPVQNPAPAIKGFPRSLCTRAFDFAVFPGPGTAAPVLSAHMVLRQVRKGRPRAREKTTAIAQSREPPPYAPTQSLRGVRYRSSSSSSSPCNVLLTAVCTIQVQLAGVYGGGRGGGGGVRGQGLHPAGERRVT